MHIDCTPQLLIDDHLIDNRLDLPEEHRRGYRYVLLYLTDAPKGARLIGSHDGRPPLR